MKILTSYGFEAKYNFIPNPYTQIYEYFFLQENDIFSIYTIRLVDDDIKLFYKFIIDKELPRDNIVAFMNQKYIWIWFINNSNKQIYETLIDIDRKFKSNTLKLSKNLIDDLPISVIERRNTVSLFSIEEGKNILFRRQIQYNLTSNVYHLSNKESFSVLPDLNDYKFDKLSLIVNTQLKQYL